MFLVVNSLASRSGQPAWTPTFQLPVAFDRVPAAGGTYSEAGVGRFRWLTPLFAADGTPDADVAALVFAGLTKRLPNGEVAPDLALDWEIGPDGLTYTFRLRPGVVWQDGSPLTPADVVFTHATLRDPAFRGPDTLARYWREIEVDVPAPDRVRFRLPEPRIGFLEQVSLGIVPSHAFSGASVSEMPAHAFNARPIGCGPYRIVSATAERVTLEASPTYHGGRPYLDRVDLRLYPDAGGALTAVRGGDAVALRDVQEPLPADLADRLRTYRRVVGSRPTVLLVNHSHPVLADRAVRQAIAIGIDRERIGERALPGRSAPATGILSPGSWAHESGAPRLEYEPDRARAVLDAGGWDEVGSDGVRTREGQRLEFTLLTNDAAEHSRAAAEISRQLAAIGIDAEVRTAGWTGVFQDFLAPRRFAAALVTLDLPTSEPDAFALLHSSSVASLNFGGWSEPETDEILDRLRAESSPEARRQAWGRLESLFAKAVPLVPVYYPVRITTVDGAVRGISPDPALHSSDRFATILDWYARTRLVLRAQ